MKNGWQTKRLGEVAEISAGNSAPQAERLFEGGTQPFFRTSDAGRIRFGDIHEAADYLNDEGIKGLRRFPKGTILFPKSGASTFLNHRVMLGVEGFVSSHLATIVADGAQVDRKFLLYFLTTICAQDMIQDHAYPSLNLPSIAEIRVYIPPLPEQQWIVGILDEAFDGIATAKANAEQNLQNARALFESRLQSVFTRRGPGWLETKLEDVTDLITCGVAKRPEYVPAGIPFLSAKNVKNGQIIWSKYQYVSEETHRALTKNNKPKLGDVLYTRVGSYGEAAIIDRDVEFSIFVSLTLIKPKPAMLNSFLKHYLNSSAVKELAAGSITGVGVGNLNVGTVRKFPIHLPPLSEQRLIVAKLDGLREETQRLESIYKQKLAKFDELKESLLHKAFAGELTKRLRKPVVIPFPLRAPNITTTDLHAGILAIAYQLHETDKKESYFGHVKAEKISHMVEAHLGIDLERNPIKDAAGPNDYPHLKRVEHRAKKAGFFLFQESEGAGGYRITKYRGFNGLIDRTRLALGDRNSDIDALLELMLPLKTKQAEIFATVYAAWNNLLLDKQPISDEAIVFEARENWHPDKLKIKRERFFDAIKWMKEHDVVPLGRGKRVESKVKKKE